MAKDGTVTLDTVMIKIESDAGKSTSNIRSLSDSLNTLKNSVKGGFNNINKLADALAKLVPTLEKLKVATKNMDALSDLAKGLSQLKEIGKPTGLIQGVSSLEKIPGIMEKMDVKTFDNLRRVSDELSQSLTPLADKMQAVANGYSAFSKIQNTFGKSASTVTRYTKQQKSMLSSLASIVGKSANSVIRFGRGLTEAFGKKSISNIKSFHSKFKQVYLSLLGTRTLFTLIRKGASEYMNFDQTLQKFTTNVWRAFGAQLAPAIEYAMELFKQFVRVVYSVIYAITGIDLIARANKKAMDGWSKSAKDTLGNLQKFDDLNVVEFPKGDEDKELIKMDKIDLSPIQKVIDWVRKLKEEIQEALQTGGWDTVGKVFAEGINGAINFAIKNIPKIKKSLISAAKSFANFLNGSITTIDWQSLGTLMTNAFTMLPITISNLLKQIKWKELGKGINKFFRGWDSSVVVSSITNAIHEGIVGISTLVLELDTEGIGKDLSKAISVGLSGLANIIDAIPWSELANKFKEFLIGFDWESVFSSLGEVLMSVFGGMAEFIDELTGLEVLTTLMKTIQETAITIDWGALSESLNMFYVAIKPFAKNVGEGLAWFYENLLVPLAEYVINELVPTFIETLSNVIDVLNIIIEAAKPNITWWWDNFLNPILKVTKMALIGLMDGLNTVLRSFSNWCRENPTEVKTMVDILLNFLMLMFTYLSVKKISTLVKGLATVLSTNLATSLETLNIPLLVTIGALSSFIWAIKEISENWSKMNGFEKIISVLGALSIAASAAAVAVGALQSAWTAGLAAAAIVAGVWAIQNSIESATKRAQTQLAEVTSHSGGGGGFRGYATGGFPEQGQYFYARENGIPELVGTIGTKTAVANNTQIVDAVSQGVEHAMLNVMSKGSSSPNIIVNIGNKKVYEGQANYNKYRQNKYGTIDLY